MPKRKRRNVRGLTAFTVVVLGVLAALVIGYSLSQAHQPKPVILYVNQGNGVVNGTNFVPMLDFASSKGFNTVFFQIYREGDLLFNQGELSTFVNETHSNGLKIFFALYFTNSSQILPNSIFGLGEDGVSLDMSTLGPATQQNLLASLQASYHGETAVTTTNMNSALKPDLLVLETYGADLQSYIRPGIVASVGVFATSNQADYKSQFQYALSNSDGVMVFDYAGLLKSGY